MTSTQLDKRRAGRFASKERPAFGDIQIPGNIPLDCEPPIIIPDENALLLGDTHAPHQNSLMLRRAVHVTQTYHSGVTRLIIGGDLFNFSNLSGHPHNAPDEDVNDTLTMTGDILRALGYYYDLFLLPGNHDEWLAKKLDNAFGFELLVSAALGRDWPVHKVTVSDLDWLMLGESWIVGHPSSYSGQGGKTPSDIADILGRNIVTWHNHIVGMSQSKSGRYVGIDAGHCTLADEHYYRYRRLSKHTAWTGGFVVIDNGFPHIYNDLVTDWAALGC